MGRNRATTLASLQCHHPIRHRPELICKTFILFYQNLKLNQLTLRNNLYTRLIQVHQPEHGRKLEAMAVGSQSFDRL